MNLHRLETEKKSVCLTTHEQSDKGSIENVRLEKQVLASGSDPEISYLKGNIVPLGRQ